MVSPREAPNKILTRILCFILHFGKLSVDKNQKNACDTVLSKCYNNILRRLNMFFKMSYFSNKSKATAWKLHLSFSPQLSLIHLTWTHKSRFNFSLLIRDNFCQCRLHRDKALRLSQHRFKKLFSNVTQSSCFMAQFDLSNLYFPLPFICQRFSTSKKKGYFLNSQRLLSKWMKNGSRRHKDYQIFRL